MPSGISFSGSTPAATGAFADTVPGADLVAVLERLHASSQAAVLAPPAAAPARIKRRRESLPAVAREGVFILIRPFTLLPEGQSLRVCGSTRSRKPSPSRLNDSTV